MNQSVKPHHRPAVSLPLLFTALLGWTSPLLADAAVPTGAISQVSADNESSLLQRIDAMVDAMASRSYGGRFIHMRGDQIDLMRTVHRGTDGERVELLVAENGEVREIRRLGDRCACLWPQRKQVMLGDYPNVASRMSGERFDALDSDALDSAGQNYRLISLGVGRVAGKTCDQVAVVPTDDLRYGYKLCIGHEQSLLLRMSMYDERGRPMEHNQFTQVESLDSVELAFQEDLTTGIDADFEAIELVGERAENAPIRQSSWMIEPLPSGYRVQSRSWRRNPVTEQYFEHLVVSDGLATASVFVEKRDGDVARQASRTELGMTMAVRSIEGMRVTAIGDVPSATVESLVENTRRVTPDESGSSQPSPDQK